MLIMREAVRLHNLILTLSLGGKLQCLFRMFTVWHYNVFE